MTIEQTDLAARRLDLAGARGFDAPGAGQARRDAIATLPELARPRSGGGASGRPPTKGSRWPPSAASARGDAGPLSDVDLVLLHYGRSLSGEDLRGLADRIWYPVWDAGVRLDHAVRTVNQCRTVASGDLDRRRRPARPAVRRGRPRGRRRGPVHRRRTTGAPTPAAGCPQLVEASRPGTPATATWPRASSPTSRRPTAACAT